MTSKKSKQPAAKAAVRAADSQVGTLPIFISWSGETSLAAARVLQDWLRMILQNTRPWLSEDISKGSDWVRELREKLESSIAGIVCLTPENLNSPWLSFEMGALSKHVNEHLVCPYLLDLRQSDLNAPFSIFQATQAESESDTRGLVRTLNTALGRLAVPQATLDELFSVLWPRLQAGLAKVPAGSVKPQPRKSHEELLEEILVTVRRLESHISTPQRITSLPARAGDSRAAGIHAPDALIQALTGGTGESNLAAMADELAESRKRFGEIARALGMVDSGAVPKGRAR